jgi:secreted trypsin-like serine protease
VAAGEPLSSFSVKMRVVGLLACLSLLVVAVLGAPSSFDDAETRIIGGINAKEDEFPEIVSVRKKGLTGTSHIMGGSILNNFWVLTAAHGIVQFSGSTIIVWAGTWDLSKSETSRRQIQEVMKSVVHPEYVHDARWNDVALLRMKQPFTYTTYIQPIALPRQGSEPSGPAILAGWGATANGIILPTYPDILQVECSKEKAFD